MQSFSPDGSQEDMATLLNALANVGVDKKKPSGSNTQSSKAVSSDPAGAVVVATDIRVD